MAFRISKYTGLFFPLTVDVGQCTEQNSSLFGTLPVSSMPLKLQ